MAKVGLCQHEAKCGITHPTLFHGIVIHYHYQSIFFVKGQSTRISLLKKNHTFSKDLTDDGLLPLYDLIDVFLPREENKRPGLLFSSFDEVPDTDSEDEILLLSLT